MSKVEKMYLVTKTFATLDKNGNEIGFIQSNQPQSLGEYGDLAVNAKCATECDVPEIDEPEGGDGPEGLVGPVKDASEGK